MKKQFNKRFFAIALAITASMIIATGCGSSEEESTSSESVVTPPTTSSSVESTPESLPQGGIIGNDMGNDSPTGVRKYMNMGGVRYAFIEDGKEMTVTTEQLGAELGSLTLISGLEINDETGITMPSEGEMGTEIVDFSTSFADGGKVYEITGHDSKYRVAVEKDGVYYIAENVGNSDDSAMDFNSYMTTADLANKVVKAEIYDHAGNNLLKTVEKEDATTLINTIGGTTSSEMTDEKHESVASAQSNGESYKVHFVLEDGTYTSSYFIPSLNQVSFGDGYGDSATLGADVASIFDGLMQTAPAPMS